MNEHANFPAWLEQPYEQCQRAVPGAMQIESVPIEDALSRVAAPDLTAPDDVPSVALAAIEGYALRSADTAGVSRRDPAEVEVTISRRTLASRAIGAQQAADLPAWFRLPENADAVAPKSDHQVANWNGKTCLRLTVPLPTGHHVIMPGSEYRKGERLLSKGQRIRAERQAALIAAGGARSPSRNDRASVS